MVEKIGIVGGGIIGIAAALELQSRGHSVVLIDRDAPGRACSFGNAGIIATSYVLPLSRPRQILAIPKMLLDPLGPLSVRPSDLPELLPWLIRFLLTTTPTSQRKIVHGLTALNQRALPAWRRRLRNDNAIELLQERGMVEVARSRAGLRSMRSLSKRLRGLGVRVADLDAEAVHELEPAIAKCVTGGTFHEDIAHVGDPAVLNEVLLARFLAKGGLVIQDCIVGVTPREDGALIIGSRGSTHVSHAVICSGHASGRLLRPLGLKVPIAVEYGYHLTLTGVPGLPSRPLAFHEESFVATPMPGGLRLAGTVELACEGAEPNWRRAEMLAKLASRYLKGLDDKRRTRWRGGRPSLPDGLPAIGRVPAAPSIIYAFGHQHLGLTLASVTAELVAQMIGNSASEVNLQQYSLTRFN
jgi:glycine/D-amino acid oxidase-like deaminating enzyme